MVDSHPKEHEFASPNVDAEPSERRRS